jgi:pimeloyl-ACP methyl ester carboxylesterase
MGRINIGRVLMGGLLAGLIINIGEAIFNAVLFAEEMNAAMVALNKPPIDTSMIVWFVIFGFGLGCMMVWLYAAIRPRFGAGVQTALCAALTVWGLAYLYPNLFFLIMNLFPRRMVVIGTIWGLFEVAIAGVAGAWLYTETPSTART